MLEKLISILEKFVDKHFIQSLIAVVFTSVIFYFTPDNFSVLLKLGKTFYISSVFIFFFLIVEMVIFIIKKIKSKIRLLHSKKEI